MPRPGSAVAASVRDFDEADLGAVVELVHVESAAVESVFSLTDVVQTLTAGSRHCRAVVALTPQDQVCGAAIARIESDRAWLLRWSVAEERRGAGVGAALLEKLERRILAAGVSSLLVLVPPDSASAQALEAADYRLRSGVSLFENRRLNPSPTQRQAEQLGAEWLAAGRWESIGGMTREKELIERDIVLPLANPALAGVHGVAAPSAVILFGPPGTGKTTFAKAIAARLGWPFFELISSQLTGDSPHAQARSLRERVEGLFQLDQIVVFIDEVDDVAAPRRAGSASPAVTNELLKLIPRFRDGERLLICATNAVSRLDPAFTRPGRFDCIIPIGPPDEDAREEIWRRYVARGRVGEVDFQDLVRKSQRFSAADIEFAAGKAAQLVFWRALSSKGEATAATADFVAAIDQVRPSISGEQLQDFEADVDRYSRY